MRSPPLRAKSPLRSKLRYPTSRKYNPTTLSTNEKRLGMLLLGLAVATVCCFGSAYYLFATRWEASAIRHQATASNSLQVVEFDYTAKVESGDPSEKYMAYLPHSGFHNQRIALENALLLARMLNRTLLVPPIRLGKGIISYHPFDKLYQLVSSSGKDGMSHCNFPEASDSLPVDCHDHFDYTFVPWNWMVNFSTIDASQRLVYRWNASDAWLHDVLKIGPNDTFSFKDASPLQYRYVDADPVDFSTTRYKEAVAISLLAQVPHRLLQFGTLFGSSRIRLRRRKNMHTRGQIREAMVFTNDLLLNTADNIKMSMGGSFVAAHLRLDDGKFVSKSEETARVVWWKLVHDVLDFSEEDTLSLEAHYRNVPIRNPPVIAEDLAAARSPYGLLPPAVSSLQNRLPCRRNLHKDDAMSLLNIPLYISTDIPDPVSHPSLRIFFDTFPCTFILPDFVQELAHLDHLKSGYDGLRIKDFLLPFLDAVVASRAHDVAGTRGSTFSQFTQDVLWRHYRGLEIVQRG